MRSIPLQGASNFRDMGGYRTIDGLSVRWRRLFRSNHLGRLTDQDVAELHQLGLRTVVDFRDHEENERTRNRTVPGAQAHHLPIDPTVMQGLEAARAAGQAVDGRLAEDLMRDAYRSFARDHARTYRALFALLLEDAAPLVFHCAAGKDRTGFAAAMVLSALDVPPETVMEDYLLTGALWRIDPGTIAGLPPAVGSALARVQPDFLEAAFDTIDNELGGMARYLETQLGVGEKQRERLRALYLEG